MSKISRRCVAPLVSPSRFLYCPKLCHENNLKISAILVHPAVLRQAPHSFSKFSEVHGTSPMKVSSRGAVATNKSLSKRIARFSPETSWQLRGISHARLRVKGGIILAGVSSCILRRADTRESRKNKSRISRIRDSRGIKIPSFLTLSDGYRSPTPYIRTYTPYTRVPLTQRSGARVRFNSSAKLSLFPPEASFTEYPISLVHSTLIHSCNFFLWATRLNSNDFRHGTRVMFDYYT